MYLAEHGLFLREGTMIDAMLISASPSTKNKERAPLHGDETDVFGDASYPGVEKREETLEHAKASIRAKVEHPFHVVKNLFMHRKTRYEGMSKNNAQMFSLFGIANLLLARR